jgi:glycerol-3-phosphate dehydrogenase (NAD(P)+)
MLKLAIIGGGAWGSALARVFENNFAQVIIYTRQLDVVLEINQNNTNHKFLQDSVFNKNVWATSEIKDLINADIILITTPTQHIRSVLKDLKKYDIQSKFLICSKGIEISSQKLITEIFIQEDFNMENVGVLSGPSFAKDVANNLPTTLLIATQNIDLAKDLSLSLKTSNIRIYYSDDIIGTQVGGALKNIIAIGCGIIRGANLGDNALSGLISRGLVEMVNFSLYKGGKRDSLYGISGLGDLILTATNLQSRNFSLGYKIGQNGGFNIDMLNQLNGTAEGYYSVKALYEITKAEKISMPICEEVYKICYENKSLDKSKIELMNRSLKQEF